MPALKVVLDTNAILRSIFQIAHLPVMYITW
jgi:hypothetical protein